MITQGKTYILQCLGAEKGGARFLNGVTENGHVNLAPDAAVGHSGAQWTAEKDGEDWRFVCGGLGAEKKRYLSGRAASSVVELTENERLTGIVWDVERYAPGVYHLKCQDDLQKSRYLNGVTGTAAVNLVDSTAPEHSGANWQLYEMID